MGTVATISLFSDSQDVDPAIARPGRVWFDANSRADHLGFRPKFEDTLIRDVKATGVLYIEGADHLTQRFHDWQVRKALVNLLAAMRASGVDPLTLNVVFGFEGSVPGFAPQSPIDFRERCAKPCEDAWFRRVGNFACIAAKPAGETTQDDWHIWPAVVLACPHFYDLAPARISLERMRRVLSTNPDSYVFLRENDPLIKERVALAMEFRCRIGLWDAWVDTAAGKRPMTKAERLLQNAKTLELIHAAL